MYKLATWLYDLGRRHERDSIYHDMLRLLGDRPKTNIGDRYHVWNQRRIFINEFFRVRKLSDEEIINRVIEGE